jgi:hypothetical protein
MNTGIVFIIDRIENLIMISGDTSLFSINPPIMLKAPVFYLKIKPIKE